jgi:hypothetical protein
MPSYTSPFTGDVIIPTDVSYASYTLDANIQLEWPSNVTTPENVAARIMDITPDIGWLGMPPANQISVGQDALIRNLGATSFDVLNYDGDTIVSVPDGKSVYLYVTENNTTAGVWGVIDFGAGTSGGTASELAGLGLLAISTTLNQSHPVQTFSNGYTFLSSDRAQNKMWTSGAGTVNLPLASTLGNNWFTILKNNGTGTLTIDVAAPDTIDLQVSKTIQPDSSAFIMCDGTQYFTVGYGQSANFLFTALVKSVTTGTVTLNTQEATSIIQEYVGSLTGDVTVVYPPVVALYVVSNQTTDNGFSLTITTSSPGGATVAIPVGQQATVISDGVNFYNANTVQAGGSTSQLVDGSASVPALSFVNEPSTGMYRPSATNMGFTVVGTERLNVNTNGIQVTGDIEATGTGNFDGGISGGDFN